LKIKKGIKKRQALFWVCRYILLDKADI